MQTTIKELEENSKVGGGGSIPWGVSHKNGLKYGFLAISEEVYLVSIIVLVGLLGFGLGRLSTREEKVKTPVKLITSDATAQVAQVSSSIRPTASPITAEEVHGASPAVGTEVVASKQGSKYHYPWCPGASKIIAANKITFASEAEAESAGYTKASNCK
jgi:hypothetical protein